MGRIIELGEASSISANDYILLSSPTNGERKFLAKNLAGSGGGVILVTQSEYDALSQDEKENGSAYLIEPVIANTIDMSSGTINKQTNMEVVGSLGGVYFNHPGGTNIGASINKSVNLTNIESIMYDVNITSFYSNSTYATRDTFALFISIGLSACTYETYPTSPQIINIYEKTGNYRKQRLDVSGMTGSRYLNIVAAGVSCTISNLKAYTNDGKIMYLDDKYLSV